MSDTTPDELRRRIRTHTYRSIVNRAHHEEATRGELLADSIAAAIGSWRFLIIQTIAVVLWVVLNLLGVFAFRWDPYPFILLNLMFSVQAAYTGPVLLLAGNRQAQKDRMTLERAAEEAEHADSKERTILSEIKHNTEITNKILERLEQPGMATG